MYGEGDVRCLFLEGLDAAYRKVVQDLLALSSLVAIMCSCRCRGSIRRRSCCLSDFDGPVEAGGSKSIRVFCVDSNIHDSVVGVVLEGLEIGG